MVTEWMQGGDLHHALAADYSMELSWYRRHALSCQQHGPLYVPPGMKSLREAR